MDTDGSVPKRFIHTLSADLLIVTFELLPLPEVHGGISSQMRYLFLRIDVGVVIEDLIDLVDELVPLH
jgi:hypothetical protein